MTEIVETTLPGVGVRLDFLCASGRRVGVIARTSGRRELLVYDQRDPDQVRAQVDLAADEAAALGEALGGPQISDPVDRLPSMVAGLVVDWLPIPAGAAPRTIGELELRRRTGASVVAIVRDDHPIPAPGPDAELRDGDTVVLVGTAEGISVAAALLSGTS